MDILKEVIIVYMCFQAWGLGAGEGECFLKRLVKYV